MDFVVSQGRTSVDRERMRDSKSMSISFGSSLSKYHASSSSLALLVDAGLTGAGTVLGAVAVVADRSVSTSGFIVALISIGIATGDAASRVAAICGEMGPEGGVKVEVEGEGS